MAGRWKVGQGNFLTRFFPETNLNCLSEKFALFLKGGGVARKCSVTLKRAVTVARRRQEGDGRMRLTRVTSCSSSARSRFLIPLPLQLRPISFRHVAADPVIAENWPLKLASPARYRQNADFHSVDWLPESLRGTMTDDIQAYRGTFLHSRRNWRAGGATGRGAGGCACGAAHKAKKGVTFGGVSGTSHIPILASFARPRAFRSAAKGSPRVI
jgi:hypothetical protein